MITKCQALALYKHCMLQKLSRHRSRHVRTCLRSCSLSVPPRPLVETVRYEQAFSCLREHFAPCNPSEFAMYATRNSPVCKKPYQLPCFFPAFPGPAFSRLKGSQLIRYGKLIASPLDTPQWLACQTLGCLQRITPRCPFWVPPQWITRFKAFCGHPHILMTLINHPL